MGPWLNYPVVPLPSYLASRGSARSRHCTSPPHSGSGQDWPQSKSFQSRSIIPRPSTQLLGTEMRLLDRESLRVVLLDTRYRLIAISEISKGTLNESLAHPREIFKPAISHSAYAFVLAHNHPSGDPAPSDVDLTADTTSRRMCSHAADPVPGSSRRRFTAGRSTGILQFQRSRHSRLKRAEGGSRVRSCRIL